MVPVFPDYFFVSYDYGKTSFLMSSFFEFFSSVDNNGETFMKSDFLKAILKYDFLLIAHFPSNALTLQLLCQTPSVWSH